MTRKWVKEELKKNPLEKIVIKAVGIVKSHKNEVVTGIVALVVVALFIGVMIRQRIQKHREAGRIFASAQVDFQSFRYNEAIEKLKTLKSEYPGSKIEDMASYMKGLAYKMQGDYENASKVFENALENHRKSEVSEHIIVSNAKVYENIGRYKDALEQYNRITQGHYLYPEAQLGMASVYEIVGEEDKAANIYRALNLNYPHYFWGEIAYLRLEALGEPAVSPSDNGFFPFHEPVDVESDIDTSEDIHEFFPSETPVPAVPPSE